MITLRRGSAYRTSYVINMNGTRRDVSTIRFYDKDGVILENDSGTLSRQGKQDEPLVRVDIDTDKEIKLKRKLKFDGEVFVMTEDGTFEKKWILYIPNEIAGFKKTKRYLRLTPMIQTVVDVWTSEALNAEIEVYRNDLRVDEKLNILRRDFEAIKRSYDLTIDEDITDDLKKLIKLKKDYDKELERVKNLDLSKL